MNALRRDGQLPTQVFCAECGTPLDPVRAARVRFSAERQIYFCSAEHADAFAWLGPSSGEASLSEPPTLPSDPAAVLSEPAAVFATSAAALRAAQREPTVPRDEPSDRSRLQPVSPVAAAAGGLGEPPLSFVAVERGPEGSIAPPPSPPRRLRFAWVAWAPILMLCGTTLLSAAQERPFWAQLIAIFVLLLAQLMELHSADNDSTRGFPAVLRNAAEYMVRVTRPSVPAIKSSSELRSGEEVVVSADEIVPVDGVIASGEALIIPWHGTEQTESVTSGSRIVAGARVVAGELVIVATKTGAQRAFHAPDAFIRHHALLKVAGWVSWVWGPCLGLLSCLLLRLQEQAWLSCVAAGVSVCATFALPGALRHAHQLLKRSWVAAAERGIAYCDAQVFERAGQVNSAVFCARGSVLSGEPDVAEVHVWRGATEESVLAIAAGAESAVHHPIASATIRAAHHRRVSIDACRGHHVSAGLGVTCSSSEGRAVVVGSRELLLRERISVAIAEETLRMLETRGNSTLLVAVDGRLIGVLGLQDTLRTGARAAFQLLLDHKIEPILLSGDARATTEAVARSLSCEHVRPEVPALGRSREVRSLIDSGLIVAVVGNSPRDDVALGAASVPIILQGAAMVRSDSPHGHERGIGLAGDRVIEATIALLIAKQGRHNLQVFLACWLLLGALGSALVTSQLAPLFMAPILGFVGVKVGGYLARKSAILPG